MKLKLMGQSKALQCSCVLHSVPDKMILIMGSENEYKIVYETKTKKAVTMIVENKFFAPSKSEKLLITFHKIIEISKMAETTNTRESM